MEFKRSGSQPSAKGSEEYFTGAVRVDPLLAAPAPARVLGASVTFEIAILEHLDGNTVDWMEKVGDDQYAAAANTE